MPGRYSVVHEPAEPNNNKAIPDDRRYAGQLATDGDIQPVRPGARHVDGDRCRSDCRHHRRRLDRSSLEAAPSTVTVSQTGSISVENSDGCSSGNGGAGGRSVGWSAAPTTAAPTMQVRQAMCSYFRTQRPNCRSGTRAVSTSVISRARARLHYRLWRARRCTSPDRRIWRWRRPRAPGRWSICNTTTSERCPETPMVAALAVWTLLRRRRFVCCSETRSPPHHRPSPSPAVRRVGPSISLSISSIRRLARWKLSDITLSGDLSGSVSVENEGATAFGVFVIQAATLALALPGETETTSGSSVNALNLAGYDGSADFAGISGTIVSTTRRSRHSAIS